MCLSRFNVLILNFNDSFSGGIASSVQLNSLVSNVSSSFNTLRGVGPNDDKVAGIAHIVDGTSNLSIVNSLNNIFEAFECASFSNNLQGSISNQITFNNTFNCSMSCVTYFSSSVCFIPTSIPPTTQPTTIEPSTTEPSTTEPSTLQPSTTQSSTLQPSTQSPTVSPSTTNPTTNSPSTTNPTTIFPSNCLYPVRNCENCGKNGEIS